LRFIKKFLLTTYAGIEIGGTKLQIRVEDEDGNVLHQFRATNPSSTRAADLRTIIRERMMVLQQTFDIAATGVGFGGPVNRQNGNIFQSFQVPGWTDFEFQAWFDEWSTGAVFIENDANVAALGEALRGAGKNYDKVFYVTLGSGVGSGFVSNGILYQGSPVEMEFGHLKLDRSGTELEDVCSGWALNKTILKKVSGHSGLLATLVKKDPGHESRHLQEALRKNDSAAKEIFDNAMHALTFCLSHVVHLLGPDTIVIGGGLSLMGNTITDAITERFATLLMDVFKPGPLLQIAALSEDVVPVGAIEFAKQHAAAIKFQNP
jgi:glucokinase